MLALGGPIRSPATIVEQCSTVSHGERSLSGEPYLATFR